MVQQLNNPNSIDELVTISDRYYQKARECVAKKVRPKFYGLYDLATSTPVILKAIHNIKSNRGSNTPGTDREVMQEDVLENSYSTTVIRIRNLMTNYKPKQVRRVYIPKSNGKQRPLGIPTIYDRIIQECIRIAIEPILEAQFFNHSYGFRPMRSADMAIKRINYIIHTTGYRWVVEGDIKGFFDNVDHNTLIHKLYNLGIRDKRVLMMIKAMLKAGIMDDVVINEKGTPQGGIISPLLANAYLNTFDNYITREWEKKETKFKYAQLASKNTALKKTNLKPCYLVRYADDWVLITNSKENAIKLKNRCSTFLSNELKLELSAEKTKITNVQQKRMKFLGFEIKAERRDKSLITRVYADEDKLRKMVEETSTEIKQLKDISNIDRAIGKIFTINSKIRGYLNYYHTATHISTQVASYSSYLDVLGYKMIRKNESVHGNWVYSDLVDNLNSIHSKYHRKLPTLFKGDKKIAITSISFVNWVEPSIKNPKETPYSYEGRELYKKRTGKLKLKSIDEKYFERADNFLPLRDEKGLYNFEYHLNRPYAFKRDRGKCRCCGCMLYAEITHIHHIKKNLAIEKVNKVANLASMCIICHRKIHDKENNYIEDAKLQKFRHLLNELE